MKIKNTPLYFYLLFIIPFFSQVAAQNKIPKETGKNLSHLDSIKRTFVKNNMVAHIDSILMTELISLNSFSNLSMEIAKGGYTDKNIDLELPTELLKLRLSEMNAKSPFNIEYNKDLENVIKSFLKYRKNSFEQLMAVSEYYFPLFEEAFAKENIPLEIKYLAIVESALNPKAISKMGASGLWQFMYNTAKQYNLKIDSYVDERHDPLKSTAAAAKYMTSMYKAFGDWDLVLASYNSGPGNVSKAIGRSGGLKNYWDIRKQLPKETQGYLPAFLATMYLYEYHAVHGLKPEKAKVKHFATDTIMIKQKISFKQISDLIEIPVAQLEMLNPSYILNVIPVYDNQNHYLRLPKDKVAIFTSNEDKIYAYVEHESNLLKKANQSSRSIVIKTANSKSISSDKIKLYTIKKGDTLTSIARKYAVSVSDLKKWNKIIGDKVTLGKSLKITAK